MAYNPNFTFADPALQNAVVNEAQVRAAADAARAQQFAETLRALRQERQAASDREERRAIREGDIRRLEANEAERRRQFDVQTGLTREAISSREKIAGVGQKEADEKEAYSHLLNFIERTSDIPTASEWNARIVGLSPERQKTLNERRLEKINDAKLVAGEVGRLSRLIGQDDGTGKGIKWTVDRLLRGSQYRNLIGISPDGESLVPLLRSREPFEPEPGAASPGRDSGLRGFIQSRMPGAGPVAGPEPIGAVQQRVSASAQPGFWGSLLDSAVNPLAGLQNFPVAARSGLFRVPRNAPPSSVIGAGPDYTQPMEPRFRVPMEQDFMPGAAMLGRGGLMPRTGGPLIDVNTGEILREEDFLAPPVFAPQY